MSTISITTRMRTSRTLSLNSPTSPTTRAGSTRFTSTEYHQAFASSTTSLVAKEEDHSFQKLAHDSRSPCPALNALANHGYLPRDGHGITFDKIVNSMEKGFGLSHGFAIFMAVGTFTLLRRPSLRPFDLAGTDRHNFIEHNASLSRADVPDFWEFGSNHIDTERLQTFLDKAAPTFTSHGEDVITTADIASHRIKLETKCPIDSLHAEIARAEFAMVMEIFGHGTTREVAEKDLETFMKDERFPEGWKPTHILHLWEAVARSKDIRTTMAVMRKALQNPERPAEEEGIILHVIHQVKALLRGKDAVIQN